MKRFKLQLIVGLLLIAVGATLLIGFIRQQRLAEVHAFPVPATSQPVASTPATSTALSGEPAEFIIPSLDIDLPVIPGVYNPATKTWTLSLDKVQYATMTPPPNTTEGNTFIYGHARRGVLAALPHIQPGATAVIKTSNQHTFYYQLASQRVTNPQDSDFLFYKGKPILTVQTCTGLLYQDRLLLTFNLIRAE